MLENDKYYETEKFRCMVYNSHSTNDLYLQICGIEQLPGGFSFHAKDRPGYHLHLVLSGKGTLTVEDRHYKIHKGQFFITKHGEDSVYQADKEQPWSYCWVGYDGECAEQFTDNAGFVKGVNVLDCSIDSYELYSIVHRILEKSALTKANELQRVGSLYEFLAKTTLSYNMLINQDRYAGEYSPEAYVDIAVGYLDANFPTAKISEVADYIGINRSYLTNLFTKIKGISPQEYLIRYRMQRAEELLKKTDMLVGEIAAAVGYENALTFSKMFKKYYGMSPIHYRNQRRL